MWKNTSKNQVQQYMQQNPYRLLALSFFATMTIGTILLMLPISNAQGHSTTLVDAAFTAVSCVSVTGLSTVDTYHHWSLFGKIIMVILIQLGGLGIVSFTTIIALVLGRRVGLKNRVLLSEYERAFTHYEEANHLYLLCRNNWWYYLYHSAISLYWGCCFIYGDYAIYFQLL